MWLRIKRFKKWMNELVSPNVKWQNGDVYYIIKDPSSAWGSLAWETHKNTAAAGPGPFHGGNWFADMIANQETVVAVYQDSHHPVVTDTALLCVTLRSVCPHTIHNIVSVRSIYFNGKVGTSTIIF